MKFENINRIVHESVKGSFHSMVWERPLKVRAAHKNRYIVKRTYGSALRFGVNYDNMGDVREKREKGDLPKENAGLIGREWIVPNLFLKSQKSGKVLLRVSLSDNSKMNTEYFLDGRPVDKTAIEHMVLKSEISPRHDNLNVFDIGIDNIISVR